jgi:NAD-dependent SIR2 family protein deacetylase
MTDVECQRCGHVFDTEREGATEHASTERCPQCGREADPDEDTVDGPETDGCGDSTAQVRIDIHVHIHTDSDDVDIQVGGNGQ